MKLAYLHDSEMPGPDASTVNVAKMCSAFAANGHRPMLVRLRASGGYRGIGAHYGLEHEFRSVGVPVPRGAPARKKLFSYAAAVALSVFRPAIVYGRKPLQLLPALRLGCRVILELHSPVGPDQPATCAALQVLLASSQLVRIVTISQALADDLVEAWPAAKGRVLVAHDGADARHAAVTPVPRPNPARPLVGYAGHLYPGKGAELIVALAQLRPKVDFVIVGGRPEDIAHWRSEVGEGAPNLVFRGMVPHAEVPAQLADCDVVLAPYSSRVQVSDGKTDVARWMSPLKIFEYMAQGLPMMASDLPVIREILEDGVTAALCPPDQPEAWAGRLDGLLADAPARCALGERARAELEACYTWRKRAELILAGL